MRKSFKITCLFLFLMGAYTVTLGVDITRKTIELPEFTSIYLNSNYTVYLKQSNKQEVTAEVLNEIFELSEFKVESGILNININKKSSGSKNTVWNKIDQLKIAPTMNLYISVRDIKAIKVNGNGKIIAENSIASNDLELAVNGSGSMNLDLKGREVVSQISGSGSLTLKGYATSNKVLLGGSGSLNAFDCEITYADVTLSGSGNCELNVADELTATIYGNGIISHKGGTKTVNEKEFGSGEVKRSY